MGDDIKLHWTDEGKTGEITASYLYAVLRVWNDIIGLTGKLGNLIIADNRRKKRKAAKRRGRWVKRKLHFDKNGRNNVYFEWRGGCQVK